MKIAISGIGGVGGYFGGLLAKHYHQSEEIEIYFIARGENEKAIQKQGLQLITSGQKFQVYPKLVTSDCSLIGLADLFISTTKTYDLEENLRQCHACINSDTVILPLQNGVESREIIANVFPSNEICDGCVYLVSRLSEPGVIIEKGTGRKLYFGLRNKSNEKLLKFSTVFENAGIDATLVPDMQPVIWEKFIFISAIATITSYYKCNIGNILNDPIRKQQLQLLLSEIKIIADCKIIPLPENVIQKTFDKIEKLPAETKTSMQNDFERGGKTELESLTGYPVRSAAAFNVSVPTFEMMYKSLKLKGNL